MAWVRSAFGTVSRHADSIEEYLAVLLLVTMTVLVGTQVTLRFLFSMGFSWMEELGRLAFVWVVFLGAVVGMRRWLHIRVTAGIAVLPIALQNPVRILGDLATLAFCAAMAWHGLELVLSTLQFAFHLPASGLSMFWAYMILPISFGLQCVRIVAVVISGRREPRHV